MKFVKFIVFKIFFKLEFNKFEINLVEIVVRWMNGINIEIFVEKLDKFRILKWFIFKFKKFILVMYDWFLFF